MDIKEWSLAIVGAVLITTLIFTTIDAISPSPEFSDYCKEMPGPVKNPGACPPPPAIECDGMVVYGYDKTGCPTSARCDDCPQKYEAARNKRSLIIFYISSIMALAIIIAGLKTKGWYGAGLLIGGSMTLIASTIQGFGSMSQYARPLVILAELIIIYVVGKRIN